MDSTSERISHRLDAARRALAHHGFDGLLITSGSNLAYLSGFPNPVSTLARPCFLLIPREDTPVLLVHEARQYEARSLVSAVDIETYRGLSVAPLPELATVLRRTGLRGGRIGAELGYEQRLGLPYLEFCRIQEELAPVVFVDAADLLWAVRAIKSPADVADIRQACRHTARAYQSAFEAVRAGGHERDVAAKMLSMLLDGSEAAWLSITSGAENYDLVSSTGTGRRLQQGDMVWMDAGCRISGFWCDYSRAATVGGATSDQLKAHRQVHDITMEGVRMVAPGLPVGAIASHCNGRLTELGIRVTSSISGLAGRIGHGIGFDFTEPPNVSEADQTVLSPGMVISIEPGIATEYGVFHVEENVAVTETGYELLTECAPWNLTECPA